MNSSATYIQSSSFWGMGTALYGWRASAAGGHIVTKWITFLFFPVMPLGSYAIDFTKDGRRAVDHFLNLFGFARESLAGTTTSSLCWTQVWYTYLYAYLPWVAGICFAPYGPAWLAMFFAGVILGSWFYAGYMMRRVWRRAKPATSRE